MPSSRAVIQGPIPADGIVTCLSSIEEQRTTGVLRFDARGVRGEVALVLGQFSAEQPRREDGHDPVELLLSLRGGAYEVVQRLPPLPVSSGDDETRRGSLSVHCPADLMNYCEHAGLTGILTLEQDHRLAELFYERGDLMGIRLDGEDDEDLNDIFGWDHGTFRVEVAGDELLLEGGSLGFSERPTTEWVQVSPGQVAVTRRSDTTGQQFLRVVEKSLTSILEEREQRRPPDRKAPAPISLPPPRGLPEQESAGGSPPKEAPRKERRDATVRVIYLGHAADGSSAERPRPAPADGVPVPAVSPSRVIPVSAPSSSLAPSDPPTSDTVPEARAPLDPSARADPTIVAPPPVMDAHDPEPPPPLTPAVVVPRVDPPSSSHLVGAAWTVVVLAVILGALALLAQIPLLE